MWTAADPGDDDPGHNLSHVDLDDVDPHDDDLDAYQQKTIDALVEIIEESEIREGTDEVVVWTRTFSGLAIQRPSIL